MQNVLAEVPTAVRCRQTGRHVLNILTINYTQLTASILYSGKHFSSCLGNVNRNKAVIPMN